MNILAVDDDPVVLSMLRGILSRAGYVDIACCKSAAEARHYLAEGHQVDCFLLDIRMPEEDGISLCTAIRAIPEHTETPIIMLTAVRDRSSVSAAYDAGATEYVTKPFDGLELGARIRSAVALNKVRERAQKWADAANQISGFSQNPTREICGNASPYLGVCGAIEFFRLESFLLRLDFGVLPTHLCAIRIDGWQEIFNKYRNLPLQHEVVKKILAIILKDEVDETLASYAGDGIFVCIKFKGKPLKSEKITEGITSELSELSCITDANLEPFFKVSVLRCFQSKLLTGRRAADFLRSAIRTGEETLRSRSSELELRQLLSTPTAPVDKQRFIDLVSKIVPRRIMPLRVRSRKAKLVQA